MLDDRTKVTDPKIMENDVLVDDDILSEQIFNDGIGNKFISVIFARAIDAKQPYINHPRMRFNVLSDRELVSPVRVGGNKTEKLTFLHPDQRPTLIVLGAGTEADNLFDPTENVYQIEKNADIGTLRWIR